MPLRTLAGAYDPSGRWRREDRERRMRVALGDGAARVVSEGPLTVAWTGSGERSTNAALAPPTPAGRSGSPLCVLDGTIYNLEDLALRTGVPPASAEAVLAAAYQRFGERSLEWLRGDFALVLWDPATERGMFARDQMGGRSLVWSAAGGALLFASEVRSLLRACERRPDPDDVAMAHWLAVSGPPEDRTLYERIHRLEPGHFARLGGKAWTTHEYWSPRPTATLSGSFTEHAGLLRDALTEAVGRRCAPDARTGVMLSGGLDSSSVAALAARTLEPTQRPARAYSATFPRHPSADESSLIQLVTDPLALAATRIVVRGGSVLAGSLPYLCAWQLPPVSPNLFFWNPLLARAAEDGIEVMLGGEGGDELFSFSPALLGDRVRRGRLLSALKLNRRIHGAAGDPSWRSILRLMQAFGLKAVVPYRAHRAIRRLRGPDSYSPPWLRPETARAFFDTHDPAAWKRAPGPLWWRWLVNATVRGRAPRLAYDHVRRRAASFGIETRQPLVDVDVIELVLRLPPEHAFDPRHSRPLLRESVAGVLPDELRLRPVKSHFDSVFHEAFAGTDLSALRALLGSDRAEVGAYVDLPTLRRELLDPPPPPAAHGRQRWALNLWRLATAECWLRSQDDPLVPERLAGELGLAEADFELQTGRPPARERPATDRTGAAGA